MTGWIIFSVTFLWLIGWIETLRHTDNTSKTWYGKIFGVLILFFLWPYVAWCMTLEME